MMRFTSIYQPFLFSPPRHFHVPMNMRLHPQRRHLSPFSAPLPRRCHFHTHSTCSFFPLAHATPTTVSSSSSIHSLPPPPPPPPPPSQGQEGQVKPWSITWPTYFEERKRRHVRTRLFNVLGIPLAFVTGVVGYAQHTVVDPTSMVFGMEAPVVYSLVALGVGAVSAIVAPISLESIWRFTHYTKSQELDQMDKDFYHRIRKYRADPSLSLIGNQVYDFYGEKITSLSSYRIWLRKQRRLKEKATIKLGAGNEKPISID